MNVFQQYSFEDIIRIGIAVVVIFAGFLSVIYIIWGGFLMIISGGNEEKIKPAVNHIRHAVFGILFLVAILFVTPTLMDLLGLEYGDYVRPSSIFETVSEVSSTIFGSTVPTSDFSPSSNNASPSDLPTSFDNL